MESKFSKFAIANIYFGLTFVLSHFIPVAWLLHKLSGNLYGEMFKDSSPALYYFTTMGISYAVTGVVVYFLVSKLNLFERLEAHYASTTLFAVGNGTIIVYLLTRIATPLFPGENYSYLVSLIGAYPVTVAKFLLFAAVARVFLGMQPNPLATSSMTPEYATEQAAD